MVVNGKYPGELIEAYWGRTVELTVINKLGVNRGEIGNGTAIHPYGLRLWSNGQNDGVPGTTQCPIPPGANYTYTWGIHQYGTTWYHSHLSLQYPNGIVGPILLTDWYHENPFSLYSESLKEDQVADSTLINGKGRFDCSSVTEPGRYRDGSYWETTFEGGKWHLLRFVKYSNVGGVQVLPSKPVKFIDIAIGQRFEVLVYGSCAEGNFWLRSEPLRCGEGGQQIKDENLARGIIRYNQNVGGNPTSKTHIHNADLRATRRDVDMENIGPVVSRDNHYV
ncbi:hypothetical protein TWF506_008234 [Arthrobotrys conoides]|uniref:Plastocyanin-like domain-containing protein n=1 Tax=Arthrobotrys conoides TaxID=74498 RepID=A0AAN8RRW7_9PEZI